MKSFKTVIFAFLFISTSIFAESAHPVTGDPGRKVRLLSSSDAGYAGVFYSDFSTGTVFIDFQGLMSPLSSVSILRDGQVVFSDPVQDLPTNTIYELNTDLMRLGGYKIELLTVDGEKIYKDIWVE